MLKRQREYVRGFNNLTYKVQLKLDSIFYIILINMFRDKSTGIK